MIILKLLQLVLDLVLSVFGLLNLPNLPAVVTSTFNSILGYINGAMGFVWLIVDRNLVIVLLPIILILHNFDHIYNLIMWIIRKIPFLGIK